MAHPIYKSKDGKRLPSVTTVIGRFKESGGLIHWAWTLGAEGKDYRKERDEAAEAGHLAHAMIEAHIKGRDPTSVTGPEETLSKARQGFEGFAAWADQSQMTLVASEVSLVSDRHGFGGSLDAIGIVNGKRALCDWKTSNRIYQDYLIQVAAYRLLWEEAHPDQPIESLHLMRFGKEYGDFHHHSWPLEVLDLGAKAFLQMLSLYELDKTLKKAVGA